jgi:hypothetical protein
MKTVNIAHDHLAYANAQLGRNITAALTLGDIEFAGANITWVEGLLINYQMPTEQLQHYLKAYQEAARLHLDERGKMIVDWLARLTSEV